ncbi:MAG: hypothetical protein PWQ29_706 [Verrucomicrobiota bacterium]|jgi:DNA-binding Xre family transcriptional regulator|nr:hypothetical protein [Verrucomicrobiota bacterium]MDK2963312.1 hypothetical protein [Verrucomicrobiota bacterium]
MKTANEFKEDRSRAGSAEESGGKPPRSIEYGPQPLDRIMVERGLKNHDLVAASKEGLTHKQVQKGRKGRRLTRNAQDKIAAALSEAVGERCAVELLFNYR